MLLGLTRLLPRRGSDPPLRAEEIRSILVIRTDDRLGNLLLTTPLLGAIRRSLPTARLGLLCAARRAPAIEGTGLYDDLWRFEKRDFFRHPWRFAAFLRALRRVGYQVAIEAGHFHAFSWTAAALALISGAKVRVGHRRGESEHVLTHAVQREPSTAYDAQVKLELLAPLGVTDPVLLPLRTELGRQRLAELSALMGERALLVNPGGRKADHRSPPELFARAALQLSQRLGLAAYVVYGPGERAMAEAAGCEGAVLLPPTDLEGLAAALRAARLVLTNDSGPLHLATAVGVPTVAVFLHADSARWTHPLARVQAVEIAELSSEETVERIVSAGLRLMAVRVEPVQRVEPL